MIERQAVPIDEGVYADFDAEDCSLGLEFIALATFDGWMNRHGTLNVPERVESRKSFPSPA